MTSGQRSTAILGAIALFLIVGFAWLTAMKREKDRERGEHVAELLALSEGRPRQPIPEVTTTTVLGEMLVPIGAVVVLTGLGMALTAPKR